MKAYSIVDMYEEVLQGQRAEFPRHVWDNHNDAVVLIRYLVEEKLQWTHQDVCVKLSVAVFQNNNLGKIFAHCFDSSPYKAIEAAYPGRFKPWELTSSPRGRWTLEVGIEATRWLIEEKLKWDRATVLSRIDIKTFKAHGLHFMLKSLFNTSPYRALEAAYPGQYKAWELKQMPKNFWTTETRVDAVKWMIEERLKWSREDICANLDSGTFWDHSLGQLLVKEFKHSPYAALETAYPNQFKPWELRRAPKSYWDIDSAIRAMHWMIEEKLKWSHDDVCTKLSTSTFSEVGLRGMLTQSFNSSLHKALETAYPNQYKPWELRRAPNSYWDTNSAIKAIHWMIEEKLKWSHDDVCMKLNTSTFSDIGLRGMFVQCFSGSLHKALDTAYPDQFKPWELGKTSSFFWTAETSTEATKWLIEKRLGWTVEEAKEKGTLDLFRKYGLGGMLRTQYSNNVLKAIKDAYSGA